MRDKALIGKARQEEVDMFKSIPVYDYVSKQNALNDPEGILIDTTWVDKNKGTAVDPDWRSRLCAREFGGDNRDDLSPQHRRSSRLRCLFPSLRVKVITRTPTRFRR